MTYTQRVMFNGSLDLDTELRYLDSQSGDYPEAQDVHIGYSDARGKMSVENIRGAKKIVNAEVNQTGRYRIIGHTEDRGNNRLYFYMCDLLGDGHGIYRFNANLMTVEKVYKNAVLNFSSDNIIHSSDYIDGTLVWTDNRNPIGQLVVADAMAGLYDSGLSEYVQLARMPPANTIVCTEPVTVQRDFTAKKSFQFIYRYVFSNGQKSVWSIISLLYNTGYDSVTNAGVLLTINNLELSRGDRYSKIISYIDIGVREYDDAIWKLYKRIKFPTLINSTISDIFLNDKAYPAIPQIELSIPFHDIPILCETIVVAENRPICGGNTFFYDTPRFQITNVLEHFVSAPAIDKMYFNTGSRYGFCALFFDSLSRCMGAVPMDATVVGQEVSITGKSRNGTYLPSMITFNIGGICPDWVAYYRFGVTLSRDKTAFLPVFVTVVSSDVNKLVFSGTFADPTPSNYVWFYTNADPTTNTYSDMCAIKAGVAGAAIGTAFGNLPMDFDGTTGNYTVSRVDTDLPVFSGSDVILVELFSPTKGGTTELFWEIPQTYFPVLDKNNIRRYGIDFQGDRRIISIGDGYGDTHYRNFNGNTTMLVPVECPSANDRYFQTWQHNVGKAWAVPLEEPKQRYDGRMMAFGDPYVQASNLNGLNSFNPSNKAWIPVELARIRKLIQATDNQINGSVLLCITETDTISYYLEKIQLLSTAGDRTLGISDQFLNKGNRLKNRGGTVNPESVHEYEGRAYWWDQNRGIYWRYSNDGLTDLGKNYKAKNYCNRAAKSMSVSTGLRIGMYDPNFDESMIMLNSPVDQYNKILAFNESKNGFSAKYSFMPEWAGTVGQYLLLFKDGNIYVHHEGDTFNEVFGVTLKPKIGIVFNQDSPNNKRFNAIAIEAQDEWLPTLIKSHEVTNEDQAQTASSLRDTTRIEWDYWYAIRRAKPNTIDGNVDIRGKYLYVEAELQDDPQYLTILYGANAITQDSYPKKEN